MIDNKELVKKYQALSVLQAFVDFEGEECSLTLGELYREWGIEYEETMYLQDLNDVLYEEGYTPIGDVIIIQL